jgi:lysine 2,3-aminomutase
MVEFNSCATTCEYNAEKKSQEKSEDFETEPPSSRIKTFRRLFFPRINKSEWNDWRWQLANRITDVESISRILFLSDTEIEGIAVSHLPFAITPYYLSLIDRYNPFDPLRRTVIPNSSELFAGYGEYDDPLGETHQEAVPGLVHRYPDRALFLITDCCSTYCRYCTRSRFVGQNCKKDIQASIQYIKDHPKIRDVLISGGDPLIFPDETIEKIISSVRAIDHVEIIRIGTKTPFVLPQRITPALVKMLKKYHPLYISVHATHPKEFTAESEKALVKLADNGIPLGSQTVLLKNINDSPVVMQALMHKLLMARVRPYYLYQCDPVSGTASFRTSVLKGVEIISALRGHTSGYAIPTFVIDAPGGGGKIPIYNNNICGIEGSDLLLLNYEGKIYRYPQTI